MSVLEAPGKRVDPEKGYVEEEEHHSEKWGSRWSFILASIGSAIGLGNFWRFPYLAYRWGGGAFFIPYWVALFVVGIPLLQIEFTLGQVFRRAATQAFGNISKYLAGIGLAGGFIAFGIVGYYCVILGWSNVMFVQSFYSEMPWSIDGVTGGEVVTKPTAAFFELLQYTSGTTKVIASYVFAGAIFMWVSIWFILVKGQAFISKAVWVTVLLPVGTLIILLIVGSTLDGAVDGIKVYIGTWDMSLLSEGQMWVDAFSQVFFSLSLATGVMSAFASMNPVNQNVVQDAIIVALANSFFSFIAGFAVFAIVGYMANEVGVSVTGLADAGFSLGGPTLAFVAYPAGLSLVGGVGANVLCIIFFLTVYMLGIDSAFSLVESVVLNFKETHVFHKYTRTQLVSAFCIVCMFFTFMYCADIGLNLLDVADRYVSSFGLAVVGFLETFAFGWVYGKAECAEVVGTVPLLLHDGLFWAGIGLFTALSLGLPHMEGTEKSFYLGVPFAVGVPLVVLSFVVPLVMGMGKAGGLKEALWAITLKGPNDLRMVINNTITEGAPGNWTLPLLWVFNIKYIVNPVLLFLVGVNVNDLASTPYGGYTTGYQAFGAAFFLVVIVIFVVGLVKPSLYADPRISP